eukprot:PhF_6_TR41588/c0_g1_i1/m.63020/K12734/PPIL3; peptidyl-prolyl cis-trans isomerase-like 3
MSLTLHTSQGDIDIILHTEQCEKTCTNFLALAASGAYTPTVFHRNEKGFILQGGLINGDLYPKLVRSIYGEPFVDEITSVWNHDSRGVLSMANRNSPNTNETQFIICYQPCPQLDGKQTVFGKVVGDKSLEVLSVIENLEGADRLNVTVVDVTIHSNPIACRQKKW